MTAQTQFRANLLTQCIYSLASSGTAMISRVYTVGLSGADIPLDWHCLRD